MEKPPFIVLLDVGSPKPLCFSLIRGITGVVFNRFREKRPCISQWEMINEGKCGVLFRKNMGELSGKTGRE